MRQGSAQLLWLICRLVSGFGERIQDVEHCPLRQLIGVSGGLKSRQGMPVVSGFWNAATLVVMFSGR